MAAIIIFGFFIRTYHVAVNPPSLSWDEVSIGYNAYSILKIGRDEHGRFLPLDFFKAYGDYKPPLAIYSAVPFIFLFGVSDLAVRLPAAFFGTLSILLTYFIVLELFSTNSQKKWMALISSALLAVSPWHVNLSRGGFEAVVALFLVLYGVWCILSSRTYPRRFYIMWLPFMAAIYTFNSARYFVPLLSLLLLWILREKLKVHYKKFFLGVAIAGICMLPILPHLVSREARLRFKEVNIFTDTSVVTQANDRTARTKNRLVSFLVNNRRIGFIRSYLMHFTDNLQPEFLFIKGDGNPKFSIQDTGELYIIEAPLLLVGFLAMLLVHPAQATFLLFWLLAAIVPAATARETPHALRILNSLPTWHIFIAFGMLTCINIVTRKNKHAFYLYAFLAVISVAYIFQVGYYLHEYYAHYPTEYSGEWQYGYREAIQKIQPFAQKYSEVVITDSIGRPYMYTAFYTKIDPKEFLQSKKSYTDAAGFYHVDGFGTYSFREVLPLELNAHSLYVWDATEVPKGVRIIDTINLLNGDPKLVIFDTGDGTL